MFVYGSGYWYRVDGKYIPVPVRALKLISYTGTMQVHSFFLSVYSPI